MPRHLDRALRSDRDLTGCEQLRDLHRVQRGALAQVVVRDEQREAVLDGVVAADAAYVARVLARSLQRCRDVGQLDTGGAGEERPRLVRA